MSLLLREQLSQSLLMNCNTHRADPETLSSQKPPVCGAAAAPAQGQPAGEPLSAAERVREGSAGASPLPASALTASFQTGDPAGQRD